MSKAEVVFLGQAILANTTGNKRLGPTWRLSGLRSKIARQVATQGTGNYPSHNPDIFTYTITLKEKERELVGEVLQSMVEVVQEADIRSKAVFVGRLGLISNDVLEDAQALQERFGFIE